MKTKLFIVLSMFVCTLFFSGCSNSSAPKQEASNEKIKTETFGVNGNCGMCKETIEKALKKDAAIVSGTWDDATKKVTVSYDSEKISIDKIHQMIADVGYDTDKIRAKDEVYNNLHGCCQYERKK